VEAGCARLVGANAEAIVREARTLFEDRAVYQAMAHVRNPFGDGHAAERIVALLAAPVSKYAVRTPFGNGPAVDETATTSPALTCTAPETGVPSAESWPAETETDDPAWGR
jgi:hypothetical protein